MSNTKEAVRVEGHSGRMQWHVYMNPGKTHYVNPFGDGWFIYVGENLIRVLDPDELGTIIDAFEQASEPGHE